MLRSLYDGLTDILFPRNCILCRRYVLDSKAAPQLCSVCYAAIEFNAPPFCLRCSRHLAVFSPEGICPTCLKYPVVFDRAWGVVTYTPATSRLLHMFKYHQKTSIRRVFQRLIDDHQERYALNWSGYQLIVPIPLHVVRRRERGFNQSELIAQILSRTTGLPLAHPLDRQRPTASQALLGQKERWTNLQGAFRMNRSFNINNKSVLLVDDLLTTGATASAAAAVLKDAGAAQVGLFAMALAP